MLFGTSLGEATRTVTSVRFCDPRGPPLAGTELSGHVLDHRITYRHFITHERWSTNVHLPQLISPRTKEEKA